MICRIDKVSFDIDGAVIALSTTDKAAAADLWDTLNGKDIKAEYKEYRKHRSLDANAMLWSIIGKMAYELCLSKDEVYRALIKSAGIYTTMAVTAEAVSDLKRMWEHKGLGWQLEIIEENEDMTTVILYSGSSAYNTKEFARLVDVLIQDCEAMEINIDDASMEALLSEEHT